MNRVVLLVLFLVAGPLWAQDADAPTLDTLRNRVSAARERVIAVDAAVKSVTEERKRQESTRDNAREKRIKAKRDYDVGEGLPAETVDERISDLEQRISALESTQASTAKRLSRIEEQIVKVVDEGTQIAETLQAARARDSDTSASRVALWEQLQVELPAALENLKRSMRTLAQALRDVQALESETMVEYVKALALHKRENLFLRSVDRLTWDQIQEAIAELKEAPTWVGDAGGSASGYFRSSANRAGIVTWGTTVFLVTLILCLVGRGLRRRANRLERLRAEADSETEAEASTAIHTAYRFGMRGLRLAVYSLIPWSAAVMLPNLSASTEAFLAGLAQLIAMYYVVWSVYREFLRPDAPEQALLKVAPAIRRKLFLALLILLVTSVPARFAVLVLGVLGNRNETTLLLLELLRILGASLALSGIVFRKSIFNSLLPPADAAWARVARAMATFARPFLQLLLPLLFILQALRFEALAEVVSSYSLAILAVVIGGALIYQLLRSVALQWVERRYADDADSEPAKAARGAIVFALRVAVFLIGLWSIPAIAGTSFLEFREALQISLPFTGADSNITLWNIGAALVTGFIVWFGTFHAKALLQYQILARTSIDGATQYTVSTLFGYVVLTLGMVIALQQVTDLSALGTIVAALSVGIGFGMQDIVSNFISGIILLFERPIRVGDTIEVGANQGRVRTINIRATTVQTLDNIFILVPNRSLISNEVVNYGYSDPKVRLAIPVGVSYSSDAEQVKAVLLKVAEERSSVLRHPVPQVQFMEFGDSSLNFRLLAWIQRADQRSRITSEINFAIFAAFREADIEIPFPQRDLHIRSAEGLVGRGLPAPADDAEPEPEA